MANKRVVVYIPEEEHLMLKGLLAMRNITVSAWVREIASRYIGKYGKQESKRKQRRTRSKKKTD